MMKRYTPEDIFDMAHNCSVDEMIIALNQGDNSNNWYKWHDGETAYHIAIASGNMSIVKLLLEYNFDIDHKTSSGASLLHYAAIWDASSIVEILLDKNIDINTKNCDQETALHWAAQFGYMNVVNILLKKGIEIDCDIDKYTLNEGYGGHEGEDEDGYIIVVADCRSIIFAEIEHRRKRASFDSFVIYHINYQPYINNIYTQCYPTCNLQVAKPSVGWAKAQAIRDKYYLDEVFFYVHLHVANFYANHGRGTIMITSSMSNSMNHAASKSDKTSTLMTILTDRLMEMLKPDQKLTTEVLYEHYKKY